MRVFDCFPFFNELDLLEFRLKFLDPFVDHFVIAESNLTHSGKTKPYYFKENRERFLPWEKKIIYIPVEQNADQLVFEETSHYTPTAASWKLENEQRNSLLRAADNMQEDDLVIMGDLDEIPAPAAIRKAATPAKPLAFSLLFHYYFLNCQNKGSSRWWKGSIAASAAQFKVIGPQGLRDKRDEYPSLANAGWHFSFLGGTEKIKEKLLAFAHTEFNKPEFTEENNIRNALLKGEDILRREGIRFQYLPLSYYPHSLQRIMRQFPSLLNLPEKHWWQDAYYAARRLIKGTY